MTPDQETLYNYVCEENHLESQLLSHDTYSQLEEIRVMCEQATDDLELSLADDEISEVCDEIRERYLEV